MTYQPVDVEIRVEAGGATTPLRIRWDGNWLSIGSIGRQWSDASGDHWLVMLAPQQQILDLVWTLDATWGAASPGRPSAA